MSRSTDPNVVAFDGCANRFSLAAGLVVVNATAFWQGAVPGIVVGVLGGVGLYFAHRHGAGKGAKR